MNSDLMIVSLVSQAKNCLHFSSLPEGKTLVSYEYNNGRRSKCIFKWSNYTMSL